ncbi:MAG TPA: hypothetical protein VGP73_03400 [Thermoanaerobaculia bacterium]
MSDSQFGPAGGVGGSPFDAPARTAVLPPETRFVTPDQRQALLDIRRTGYARRFASA